MMNEFGIFFYKSDMKTGRLSVDHLRRPDEHAGWSQSSVFLRRWQGSRMKKKRRSQEVGVVGAVGAPPSLAAGQTHTHTNTCTQQGCLKDRSSKNRVSF